MASDFRVRRGYSDTREYTLLGGGGNSREEKSRHNTARGGVMRNLDENQDGNYREVCIRI